MSFAWPTPLQISIHEAGHAYAFSLLAEGEWPVSMRMQVIGRTAAGWSKRLKLSETDFADCVGAELGEDAKIRWCATGEIIVALSGPLAEARQREGSSAGGLLFISSVLNQLIDSAIPPIDADFEHVRRMLAILGDEGDVERCRTILFRTSDLLDANWASVRRLARDLLKRETLGLAEIEAHFTRFPAVARKSRAVVAA